MQVFAEDERVAQLPPGRFRDALAAVQRANASQIAGTILTQMQATLRAKQQVGRSLHEAPRPICILLGHVLVQLKPDTYSARLGTQVERVTFCDRPHERLGSGGCIGGTQPWRQRLQRCGVAGVVPSRRRPPRLKGVCMLPSGGIQRHI